MRLGFLPALYLLRLVALYLRLQTLRIFSILFKAPHVRHSPRLRTCLSVFEPSLGNRNLDIENGHQRLATEKWPLRQYWGGFRPQRLTTPVLSYGICVRFFALRTDPTETTLAGWVG